MDAPPDLNSNAVTLPNTTESTEAMTKLSTMEIANQMLISKIAMFIHMYWFPIMVPAGIVGNCLAFVVLLQQHNISVSCCLYMAALAVSGRLPWTTSIYGYSVYSYFWMPIMVPVGIVGNCLAFVLLL